MIKIGDFSRLALVSIKALRHYDELGLLKPAHVDRFTGYRYYAVEQLPQLNRILALKDLGLSLEQIAALLRTDVSAGEIRGMLRLRQAETQSLIQEAQAQLLRVEARLRQIEKEGLHPMYEVVLKKLPTQRVAAIRRVLPSIGAISTLFGELFGPQMNGARYAGPPIAIYHDGEFKDADADVEVAIPIAGPLPDGAPAEAKDLAGGEMACVIYQGPYEGLGEGYSAVMAWLEPNGYRIAGPLREVYLRGPGEGANPAEYVTEIQVPAVKV